MFRVTVDVFSGRSNPSWIVTDQAEGQAFLKGIAEIPDAITKPNSGFGGWATVEWRSNSLVTKTRVT